MYKASVTRGEQSTSANPLGRAARSTLELSHQTRSRKHIYLEVKNDRGDSNIDYIINAKIALLKFREVCVNSSLPNACITYRRAFLALAVHRNRRATYQLCFRTAQEQDDLSNLFR